MIVLRLPRIQQEYLKTAKKAAIQEHVKKITGVCANITI